MLGERKTVVTGGKVRIKCDSTAKQALGDFVLVRLVFVKMPQAALIGLPHIQASGRFRKTLCRSASASAGSMIAATLPVISSWTAKISVRSRS